jgi:predicted N-acetyltransferase YhbS
VCSSDEVVGFYTLATGAVQHAVATSKVRRNSPDPVPVVVLARLAVAKRWEGKGIGSGLLKDAFLRTLNVSEEVGIRAILVHAISDKAKAFYEHHGFKPSIVEPMTLMITLPEIVAHLS